jgi:hypothetical protein
MFSTMSIDTGTRFETRSPIVIIIIIIIIIIIGKDTISFMQGIYTYVPETNHVPKEYNFAAILSLLFMAPISYIIIIIIIIFVKGRN